MADFKDSDDALGGIGLAVVGVKVKTQVASAATVAGVLPVSAAAAEEHTPEGISACEDHTKQMRLEGHATAEIGLLVEAPPPPCGPEHGRDIVAVEQAEHRIEGCFVHGTVIYDLRQVGGDPLRPGLCSGSGCH
jgi:hypothetical protein